MSVGVVGIGSRGRASHLGQSYPARLLPLRLHDHDQLLENFRALIGLLFLLGNLFIFIPAMFYGGSLFIQTMFKVEIPLLWIAIAFALVGSAYAVLGGCAPWLFLMLNCLL